MAKKRPEILTLTAYRKSLIHECVTGQRRGTAAELDCMESRHLLQMKTS